MTKKLYICIGCKQLHYDEDYDKSDGDREIKNIKPFFINIDIIKEQLIREKLI